MRRLLIILLVLPCCQSVCADQSFVQVGCDMAYPEAMALLQDAIASHGYSVSRVQHVDKGLRKFGYEADLYSVVFYGRPQQMPIVRENYPGLMPYLPLKIMLYEDGESVVASALEPLVLAAFFDDSEIRQLLESWQEDLVKILSRYGQCGETVRDSDKIRQSFLPYT